MTNSFTEISIVVSGFYPALNSGTDLLKFRIKTSKASSSLKFTQSFDWFHFLLLLALSDL